jgi:glutamine cyclotransferase
VVIKRHAHPGRGFTQGIISDGRTVYESTGLYGESALCRYPLGARQVEQRTELSAELFAEGICMTEAGIWQLTWQDRVALRWDTRTMELIEQVPFNREGWGMCAAAGYVITSDGTSELVRRDLQTLAPQAVVHVRCEGRRVLGLNDLAWSAGTVWANVAGTHYLAGIDPDTGEVTDIANARAADERHFGDDQAILNGIATLPTAGEFLLTGKGWRAIRHVRLTPARPGAAVDRLLAGLSR